MKEWKMSALFPSELQHRISLAASSSPKRYGHELGKRISACCARAAYEAWPGTGLRAGTSVPVGVDGRSRLVGVSGAGAMGPLGVIGRASIDGGL